MGTIDKIKRYLKAKKSVTGKGLSELLGISRQAVNRHIKVLVQKGDVIKEGTTRWTVYKIGGKGKTAQKFRKSYVLKGADEDRVFREVELFLNLRSNLRKNVFDIVRYV